MCRESPLLIYLCFCWGSLIIVFFGCFFGVFFWGCFLVCLGGSSCFWVFDVGFRCFVRFRSTAEAQHLEEKLHQTGAEVTRTGLHFRICCLRHLMSLINVLYKLTIICHLMYTMFFVNWFDLHYLQSTDMICFSWFQTTGNAWPFLDARNFIDTDNRGSTCKSSSFKNDRQDKQSRTMYDFSTFVFNMIRAPLSLGLKNPQGMTEQGPKDEWYLYCMYKASRKWAITYSPYVFESANILVRIQLLIHHVADCDTGSCLAGQEKLTEATVSYWSTFLWFSL